MSTTDSDLGFNEKVMSFFGNFAGETTLDLTTPTPSSVVELPTTAEKKSDFEATNALENPTNELNGNTSDSVEIIEDYNSVDLGIFDNELENSGDGVEFEFTSLPDVETVFDEIPNVDIYAEFPDVFGSRMETVFQIETTEIQQEFTSPKYVPVLTTSD